MQIRNYSARIASALLILHGAIEVASLAFTSSIALVLVSFGGVTGEALERNASAIAMYGVLWGIARFIAAWGSWSLRKWALALGVILSSVTIVAAVTIIPAGLTDTLFAVPVLILTLYAWFGDERIGPEFTPLS